jgi:hypothetical protein
VLLGLPEDLSDGNTDERKGCNHQSNNVEIVKCTMHGSIGSLVACFELLDEVLKQSSCRLRNYFKLLNILMNDPFYAQEAVGTGSGHPYK